MGASLFGNMLAGEGIVRAIDGVFRACKGTNRAAQDFNSAHPLTNFEIQKYCQDEPTFICVYSSYNLSKTKDGIYVINLDEYKSIGTHWIALNVNGDN